MRDGTEIGSEPHDSYSGRLPTLIDPNFGAFRFRIPVTAVANRCPAHTVTGDEETKNSAFDDFEL